MSKVKSAVITALVVIAIIVAAVFGTVSFNVGAAQRYNSIAARIPLGSEFSGYVYTTVYPEGVISANEYDALEEEDKSAYEQHGGVYVSFEECDYADIASLSAAVAADADILSARLGDRGLTDYSVAVRDDVTIFVALPSGYSYAAYKGSDSAERSEALSAASSSIAYLVADGELTLRTTDASITTDEDSGTAIDMTRNKDEYTDADILGTGEQTYPFVSANEDVSSYFSSVTAYAFGGSNVLSFNLTEYGRERMSYVSTLAASSESQTIYVCVGDTQVLSINCTSTIDSDNMQFALSTLSAAKDTAAVLSSVVAGNALSVAYNAPDSVSSSTATGGENAALMAFIASIVVLAALCAAAVIKYKKLGGVLAISFVILALAMLYTLFLLSIQVTFEVLAVWAGALILLAAANLVVLGEVRAQCKTGKTMQAAVKAAYKRTLWSVIDIHVIVLAAAILMAAVCQGAAAACGLILVVGTLVSYVLYWFTRFMWFVLSSPQRNKFAFGGFKREVYGDDE